MDFAQVLILIAELVGTVAFAVSGALSAIERKLDVFGIIFIALITAVGGGMIRDIILGLTPPAMFVHGIYVITAFSSAVVIILASYFKLFDRDNVTSSFFLGAVSISDALGLGIFTLVGIDSAIKAGFGENAFLAIFVGVTTGIGGGIIRDMLLGRTPLVLQKDIYAVAAIAGGLCFYITKGIIGYSLAMLISVLLIVIIRLTSLRMHWNLPVVGHRRK